ncbi:MAG: glycosyltransferase family 4 protein [Chloroflexi bacterium]|nr:glycosyltransferase family 4 protein [Chloroflexota bacterium]
MRLALVSDVFPPKCGGSGWSTFYLAQALQQRGHQVAVVVPKEGHSFGHSQRLYEGLEITEFIYPAARLPFVRNYTRNERLYPRFAAFLENFFREHEIEVAHGQHYLTIPPTVMAAQRTGIVSVATVRDYWPLCYWTTHLRGSQICPGCSAINRLKCLPANQGALGLVAAPLSLYMGANLRLKQHWLAQADATLAVSSYIGEKLASFVPSERLHILPNFVDLDELEREAKPAPLAPEAAAPFLLYVGKLEENKGIRLLLDLLRQARPALPTLIAGDGALRAEIEQVVLAEGLNLKILGWVEHAEVLRLLARTELLLFPSLWPEPLSRVLLEATGLGTLVLAMDTGGTPDILRSGENGLLAHHLPEMVAQLQSILKPENSLERIRLRQQARRTTQENFSKEVVVSRVEELYKRLAVKRAGPEKPGSQFQR